MFASVERSTAPICSNALFDAMQISSRAHNLGPTYARRVEVLGDCSSVKSYTAMSGFFEELKRRKVYRVAAAYIIAAGFIIQVLFLSFLHESRQTEAR
jgi:hypothetical protein